MVTSRARSAVTWPLDSPQNKRSPNSPGATAVFTRRPGGIGVICIGSVPLTHAAHMRRRNPSRGGQMRLSTLRRRRAIPIVAAAALVAGLVTAGTAGAGLFGFGDEHVGRQADGTILLPNNEQISPAGHQVQVAGRIISSRLRPDGQTMAALTWQDFTGYLSIVNIATG